MFIIAGLGNPDEKYQGTRHNVGFDVVDRLAEKYQIEVDTKKHRALIGKGVIEGQKVLLVKPQTYMNLSGEAVHEAVQFYKIPADHVLVIYDDVSLPVGKLRVRPTGSAGGHNGIKSIIAQLGTEEFPRIRVGVGAKPNPQYDLADWVLSKFSEEDMKALQPALEHAADAAKKIVSGDMNGAMNLYSH